MSDNKEQNLSDSSKLDRILEKLDSIETGIFKLIEDKLIKFREEFNRLVDRQFSELKEYMDSKISGVKDELEIKIDDHEDRISVVEREMGIKSTEEKGKGIKFYNIMTRRFIIIIGSATLLNAILWAALLYFSRG